MTFQAYLFRETCSDCAFVQSSAAGITGLSFTTLKDNWGSRYQTTNDAGIPTPTGVYWSFEYVDFPLSWGFCVCIFHCSSQWFRVVVEMQELAWSILSCCNGDYGRLQPISFTEGYSTFDPQGNFVCHRCDHCALSHLCSLVWCCCYSRLAPHRQVSHLAIFDKSGHFQVIVNANLKEMKE